MYFISFPPSKKVGAPIGYVPSIICFLSSHFQNFQNLHYFCKEFSGKIVGSKKIYHKLYNTTKKIIAIGYKYKREIVQFIDANKKKLR